EALQARLRELGREPSRTLIVQAGVDYLQPVVLFAGAAGAVPGAERETDGLDFRPGGAAANSRGRKAPGIGAMIVFPPRRGRRGEADAPAPPGRQSNLSPIPGAGAPGYWRRPLRGERQMRASPRAGAVGRRVCAPRGT